MFELVLNNSLTATLLAILVAVIAWPIRDPRLKHALLILVMVKLLTAPLTSVHWHALPSIVGSPGQSATWLSIVAVCGAGAWFAYKSYFVARFYRQVVCNGLANDRLSQALTRVAEAMKLQEFPQAIVVDCQLSPMLWCVGCRCYLLVPCRLLDRIDDDELELLVAHELAHFQRRDHWVRQLEFFAMGLFWWLPTTWWVRRQIELAEEQSCDQIVLQIYSDRRREYANALLSTLEFISDVPRRSVASHFCRPEDWRRRFETIVQGPIIRQPRWLMAVFCVAAVVVLCVSPSLKPPANNSVLTVAFAGGTWSLPLESKMTDVSPTAIVEVSTREPQLPESVVTAQSPDGRVQILAQRLFPNSTSNQVHLDPNSWMPAVSQQISARPASDETELVDLVWDVASSTGIAWDEMQITAVAFSSDSELLATGEASGRVRLWDTGEGCQLGVFDDHTDVIRSVAFSPDGTTLATGDQNGIVKLWNVSKERETLLPSCVTLTAECQQQVTCVRFSRDGGRLGIVSANPEQSSDVALWDLSSLTLLNQINTKSTTAVLDFHPNGTSFVTGDWDGTVTLWDATTGYACKSLSVDTKRIIAASFSQDACDLFEFYRQEDNEI